MSALGEGMIEFKTVERIVQDGKFVMIIKYVDGELVGATEKFIRGDFQEQENIFDKLDI